MERRAGVVREDGADDRPSDAVRESHLQKRSTSVGSRSNALTFL